MVTRSIGRTVSRGVVAAVIGGAALSGLSGCLNQSQYDRVREAYASCQAQNKELERERNEAQLALDQMRGSVGRGEGTLASLQRENADLRKQLEGLSGNYADMQSRIEGLKFGPLDAQTTSDLTDLADKYSNLIAFDAQRGMLRIASDLTFDSGSDDVKSQAQAALRELAGVLNTSSASQYDVVVEGHTDSQRMANPATLREHKSNRGLSVHRSISVISELEGSGVAPQRLLAAGWGEWRPTVTNSATGNTPQNRRVEIYLAKLGGAAPSTPTNTPATDRNVHVPDDIK